MFEFRMPSMGADMEDGILVAWNYAVGDVVRKGDIICEIETAKGNIDVEIWEGGTVSQLLAKPGDKVPVGEVIARLDVPGQTEAAGEVAEVAEVARAAGGVAEQDQEPRDETRPTELPTVKTSAVRPAARTGIASPAARRRAAELGIDLTTVIGSGPGGAVTLDDVDGAGPPEHHHRRVTPVAQKIAEGAGIDPDEVDATGPHDTVVKADVEREVARRSERGAQPHVGASGYGALREAIARAMAKSKREIPHYYLQSTIDVSSATNWMERRNAERPVSERLVFAALVARAVALAARDVPEMNGTYEGGVFQSAGAVHLGFAVAMRGGGVVAPAIHDLERLSVDEAMAAIKDVVRRVRGGKLRSSEMTDPTITLTSLGDAGVDTVFGVIYPPQVAIVGLGTPREIPFASDGMLGVRTCAELTLSGDHRVSDGLSGAKFLQRIAFYLTTPEQL